MRRQSRPAHNRSGRRAASGLLLLLLALVAGAGIAYALTQQGRDRYEATARLVVRDLPSPVPEDRPDPAATAPETSPAVAARGAAQVARKGVSESVARELGDALPLTGPGTRSARQEAFAARLRDETRAEPDPDSDEVLVTVSWPDGEVAAQLANLVADATATLVNREHRQRLVRQAEAIEGAVATAPLGAAGSDARIRRDELVLQATRLRSAADRAIPARVSARAVGATDPVDRDVPLWTAVGAVGGLLVGLLLLFVVRVARRGRAEGAGAAGSRSGAPAVADDHPADAGPADAATDDPVDAAPDALVEAPTGAAPSVRAFTPADAAPRARAFAPVATPATPSDDDRAAGDDDRSASDDDGGRSTPPITTPGFVRATDHDARSAGSDRRRPTADPAPGTVERPVAGPVTGAAGFRPVVAAGDDVPDVAAAPAETSAPAPPAAIPDDVALPAGFARATDADRPT
ncbi:MAG: hypothetical protein M0P31_06390 [Solirubrobacteraceae bacterium]|nr:hypothetical protein [Solirubrobacteraceae bacterium]